MAGLKTKHHPPASGFGLYMHARKTVCQTYHAKTDENGTERTKLVKKAHYGYLMDKKAVKVTSTGKATC